MEIRQDMIVHSLNSGKDVERYYQVLKWGRWERVSDETTAAIDKALSEDKGYTPPQAQEE